jgi:hypothetical protein
MYVGMSLASLMSVSLLPLSLPQFAELVVDEAGGVPHCFGVDVLDQHSNSMTRFLGLATMLATGGAGQVYPSTTNPHVATGDGMAMAYRAGAAISNMEFVQFHPTALYSPPKAGVSGSSGGATERTFLITEAVRGEGGMLFNMKGEWRCVCRRDFRRLELLDFVGFEFLQVVAVLAVWREGLVLQASPENQEHVGVVCMYCCIICLLGRKGGAVVLRGLCLRSSLGSEGATIMWRTLPAVIPRQWGWPCCVADCACGHPWW